MPPDSFGFYQVLFLIISAAFIFGMKRLYDRTEYRMVRFIAGGMIGVSGGVMTSYLVSLAAVPLFSTPADYRFKFWAVFIGLSVIAVILFPLIAIFITQKLEMKESGE
ncbi:MAG: hypothetical protein LWY06_19725 [Firmicutes bacterium]|nr:hypothetical protein [Bacillota bacterium]